MNIINLTPHEVNIMSNGTIKKTFVPSGLIARVSVYDTVVDCIDGVDILKEHYSDVVDLPDPTDDTIYIVSLLVCQACPDRTDLVHPSRPVRDDAGRIVGCGGLGHFS